MMESLVELVKSFLFLRNKWKGFLVINMLLIIISFIGIFSLNIYVKYIYLFDWKDMPINDVQVIYAALTQSSSALFVFFIILAVIAIVQSYTLTIMVKKIKIYARKEYCWTRPSLYRRLNLIITNLALDLIVTIICISLLSNVLHYLYNLTNVFENTLKILILALVIKIITYFNIIFVILNLKNDLLKLERPLDLFKKEDAHMFYFVYFSSFILLLMIISNSLIYRVFNIQFIDTNYTSKILVTSVENRDYLYFKQTDKHFVLIEIDLKKKEIINRKLLYNTNNSLVIEESEITEGDLIKSKLNQDLHK